MNIEDAVEIFESPENGSENLTDTFADAASGEKENDDAKQDEKHQKFLAGTLTAVRKAVLSIEKVGKFSNDKQYCYSEEEVERMFGKLQESLDDTKKLFCQKQEFTW